VSLLSQNEPVKKPNKWYQRRSKLKDGKKNKRPEKEIGFINGRK
jgi:hypothetical protein